MQSIHKILIKQHTWDPLISSMVTNHASEGVELILAYKFRTNFVQSSCYTIYTYVYSFFAIHILKQVIQIIVTLLLP